jgi:hypothetical protein
VHWHAQEHHDKIELHLSVHPPEFPIDNHDHDGQQDHKSEHEHEDTHFVGDWDYTFQTKTFSFKIAVQPLDNIDILNNEPKVLSRKPQDIPLKFTQHYLQVGIPNRAPPQVA